MMTPTLSKATIRARRDDYLRRHSIDSGYTRTKVEEVLAAPLRVGTHLLVEIALQYDGKQLGGDQVANAEKQLPYKYSYDLDRSSDCLVFVRNIVDLMFNRSIGTYTQNAYDRQKDKQVPWADIRPTDLLLFKLSNRNPNATHAALAIGNGLMLHTTSESNALRVEKITKYSAASRSGTGCFRILTQAEYESQIVQPGWAEGGTDMSFAPGDSRTAQVKQIQTCLVKLGYDLGKWGPNKDGIDGGYGDDTAAGVSAFQVDYKVKEVGTGIADEYTLLALAFECSKLTGGDVSALQAIITADKAAFGQIADLAAARK